MSILDFIFPKRCLGCGREGNYLCAKCLSEQTSIKQICPGCYKPSIDGLTHARCKRKLGLDGLTLAWKYEGVVRKAILAMKYKYAFDIAGELAKAAAGLLRNEPLLSKKDKLLVPIPAHGLRKNWRGFNQSEVIGKLLAREMGWGYEPNLLFKNTTTLPQTELKRKARLKNLRGTFALNSNRLVPSDCCIVLFDDVFTTGSTLKEACKVLKRAGVKKVLGITLARTI